MIKAIQGNVNTQFGNNSTQSESLKHAINDDESEAFITKRKLFL